MANYNLSNQDIKDTFQQLAQVSSSIEGGITGSGVTDGTGSRVTNLHVTASNALDAISSSYALTASFAENVPTIDTGSFLITASNVDAVITYTKADGSVFTNTINNVANADEAKDLVITVKNTSGGTLTKGTVVHAVDVSGENVDVIAASNDSSAEMPAIGVLSQDINNNASGTCIIAGRLSGINTIGLTAGASVFVGTNGSLTGTAPTGNTFIQNIGTAAKINASDGELIIQGAGRVNSLPNLTNNYLWKGDINGVPQEVTEGSLNVNSALTATSSSYALSASYAVSASVEIIKEVSSSYADFAESSSHADEANRVGFTTNVTSTGIYTYPFLNSTNGAYIDFGGKTEYQLQQDNTRGEIITSGSTLVVGAGGGDLKVTGSSNIDIQAGDINFKDGNVSILTNGGNVLTNNGSNTAVQGTTNVDIRDAGTIFMRTGQNAVGGIQLAGAQVKVLGDSSPSASLRVDGDDGTGTGALALEVKSTITSQSVDIQGGTRFSGSIRSLGGQIQLGDTGSGNSLNIPVNGTALFKGNTDFTNGAVYFNDQLNFGGSLNSSGGGSSVNWTDGTNIQISADMNLSASKQLIGTASYAMFAETTGGTITNAQTASYINPLEQDVQITGSVNVDGDITTAGSGDSITAGGYIYSVNGAVTSGTGLQAGYAGASGNISIKNSSNGGLQFPSIEAFTNTTDFATVFSSHRIQDTNPTGSGTAQPVSMELSSFTGRDGVYPVAQFRLGPIEGSDSTNTAFWSSENYPGLQFEKSATFNDAVTISSSLNVSGSTDIDGVLSLPGIANVSASIAAGGGGGAAFPFTGSAGISGSLLIDGEAPNLDINTSVKGGTPNLRMYQAYNGSDTKFANISINDTTGTYSLPSLFGRFSNAVTAFGNAAGSPFTVIAGGAAGGAFNHWGLILDQTGDIKSLKEMNMYSGAKVSGSLVVTGSATVIGDIAAENIVATTAVTSSNGFSSTGFNKPSKFNGDVSSFSLTTTGEVLAKASFSTTAGMTLGEVGTPKRLGYFKANTDIGSNSGVGAAAGLYIVDANQSDAFVGTIANFSNPFDAADSGSFIMQGGANADSNYQNTIMYANEANGFPHFVKSTYFDKPVFISGSQTLTGSLNINGTTNANGSIVQTSGVINALGGNGGNAITVGSSGYGLQYPSMNIFTDSASYAASGGVYAAHRLEDRGTGDFATFALSTFNADDPGKLALEVQYRNDIVWWISEAENRFHVNKEIKAVSGLQATGSVDITGSLSLNGSPVGAAFPYVGDAQITGSLSISGSVVSNIATPPLSASDGTGFNFGCTLDFNAASMFEIDLDNASTYTFDTLNVAPGKTATLKVNQAPDGNGAIGWGSEFRFPGGVVPSATTGAGAEDIYSFVMYDSSAVYTVQTANLSP